MTDTQPETGAPISAGTRIDTRIAELGDWRGMTLAEVRRLIRVALPDVVEEWKWEKPSSAGVACWSRNGGICTGEVYKQTVKLTFFAGASLDDPSGLFNASLDGRVRRAIDLRDGARLDEEAFVTLVRSAASFNAERKARRGRR